MSKFVLVIVLSVLALACVADADVVRLYTVLGSMDVELDWSAPATCANFLRYVNGGLYDNSIFHRNSRGFVLQGGGYSLADPASGYLVDDIPAYDPIENEASLARPNVYGTIAMAQVGTDPNSATSQWFINTGNNSPYLDTLNGGFTVFGSVVDGLDVLDALVSLDTWAFNSPFGELPALDTYTQVDYDEGDIPDQEDLTTIYSAVLLADADGDGDVDAADYIALKRNFGTDEGATWEQGDFDHDGDVDAYDKYLLEFSYGLGLPDAAPAASLATSVPEPATLSLLAVGFVTLARRRRR